MKKKSTRREKTPVVKAKKARPAKKAATKAKREKRMVGFSVSKSEYARLKKDAAQFGTGNISAHIRRCIFA